MGGQPHLLILYSGSGPPAPGRIVSVDAGTLTTRTFKFDRSDLNINAIGPVNIALCDADGDGVAKLKFSVKPGGRLYSFTVVAPREHRSFDFPRSFA